MPAEADFAAAMERMRRLRAHISRHDSVPRFQALGVDVFLGDAAFADRHTVEVAGATLKFKKAVVATGTRAARPPIEGLEAAGYLTNETVFNLTERPRRLLVIGGGPLGCELAQAFARLGCNVIMTNREPYFLPGEERDAAEILADSLRDGIEVRLNTEVEERHRTRWREARPPGQRQSGSDSGGGRDSGWGWARAQRRRTEPRSGGRRLRPRARRAG